MNTLSGLWARFRRPPHIAPWGGDPINPWLPVWEPDPKGEVR